MQYSQDSKTVQLCARGMELERQGSTAEASILFNRAWEEAIDDFEKFTAAHYVARHQESVPDKLKWDETALQLALKIKDGRVTDAFPSLYLNIAKCYEDLNDPEKARNNYELAHSFTSTLPADGYGYMIKKGIENGLKRVSQ